MPDAAYERTHLWKKTLAAQDTGDPHKDPRQVLNQAYKDLRERAKPLAAEIARDLPDFTQHDITHLDALWSLADRIGGRGLELTPAEAFVLGGAFLVHDLAMGLAAYPEEMEELRRQVSWRDSISQILRGRLGRPATPEEIEHPDEKTAQLAKVQLLRELHAQQAERLPSLKWQWRRGAPAFYLIDKPELRVVFGGLIGKLAASHHWPLAQVRREFEDPVGAAAEFPPEWTIDPIKVACLLRAADAAHLDARRAPIFLRALRQPAGSSADHWEFQAKLLQPTVENNRLVYTANPPGFSYEEASAWWLCLDTLRMVDEELRHIDDLLVVSLRRPYRFDARGVEGVYNLEDFARRVRTNGWEPVDTRVHVTNVAAVVRSLGGKELYGDDSYVPLRELIQNGCDAVRARRLLQNRPAHWGEVTVRIGQEDGRTWFEVEDNGVGMSTRVLKGALLDFGVSFWGSPEMRQEYPGLLGKASFEPVGKYGIGFFSIFMWGDRVRVTTRRYDAALDDTLVLSFDAGLESRPILRKADAAERLQDGGTRVRVWCNLDEWRLPQPKPNNDKSAVGWTKRLAWLCPTLDVTLLCQQHLAAKTAVVASDWVEMDGYELLRRTFEYEEGVQSLPISDRAEPLTLLRDGEGQPVGRALITLSQPRSDISPGVVTVGGMRISQIQNVAGILLGKNTTASRRHAVPVVPLDELKRWATRQANILLEFGNEHQVEGIEDIAAIVTALNGDISQFQVRVNGVLESIEEIRRRKDLPNEVVIVDKNTSIRIDADGPLVFVVEAQFRPLLSGPGPRDVWPPLSPVWPDGRARLERTTAGVLISAIAASWGVETDSVLAASRFNPENGRFDQDPNEALFEVIDSGSRTGVGERIFAIRKP